MLVFPITHPRFDEQDSFRLSPKNEQAAG